MPNTPIYRYFRKSVETHYINRDFPHGCVSFLLEQIDERVSDDETELPGIGDVTFVNMSDPDKRSMPIMVASLVDKFPASCFSPINNSHASSASAIFAFAFGYRLNNRPQAGKSNAPNRLPGLNNHALAGIASRLKTQLNIKLCAQFEIADALDDLSFVRADEVSPIEDLGTIAVAASFPTELLKKGSIVHVVAHAHHTGRCCLNLREEFQLIPIPAVETYANYDPAETQERVVSPYSFIISDFVSMATR